MRRLAELNVTRDDAIDPHGLFACDDPAEFRSRRLALHLDAQFA
jgi:hypothetical protein